MKAVLGARMENEAMGIEGWMREADGVVIVEAGWLGGGGLVKGVGD